jgi:hypothetical protein
VLRFALASFAITALLGCAAAFTANDTVVINQATVMSAGGFPYRIIHPGHYRLSSDLVVPAETNGIEILTDDATLNLSGFSISGPTVCLSGTNCVPGSLLKTAGIVIVGLRVAIRNGKVRGFSRGIRILKGRVEEVRVLSAAMPTASSGWARHLFV